MSQVNVTFEQVRRGVNVTCVAAALGWPTRAMRSQPIGQLLREPHRSTSARPTVCPEGMACHWLEQFSAVVG
jgi:hypothetical protein